MEPGFVPKIHFARYDRRELDTNYRAPWIFSAVPGGNGSACAFRLMLAKFHLYLHLPSTEGQDKPSSYFAPRILYLLTQIPFGALRGFAKGLPRRRGSDQRSGREGKAFPSA